MMRVSQEDGHELLGKGKNKLSGEVEEMNALDKRRYNPFTMIREGYIGVAH